jgi:hypothetical protein
MLLHQAVQRRLLGAVAFVVDRGAIASPLGLLRRGSPTRNAVQDGSVTRRHSTVWRSKLLAMAGMVGISAETVTGVCRTPRRW